MTINWFIEERLAEDERLAKEASESSGPNWRHALSEDYPGQYSSEIECDHDSFAQVYSEQAAAHIAHHDPARVLRQVEHARKVLARHRKQADDGVVMIGGDICAGCGVSNGPRAWPCAEVRDLAATWSDHRHYRQEWNG